MAIRLATKGPHPECLAASRDTVQGVEARTPTAENHTTDLDPLTGRPFPPVLTVSEASRYLGLSTKSVRAMLACGELYGRMTSGGYRWLIPRAALEDWLSGGEKVAHHG